LEQNKGLPPDVKKVEEMTPIVTKKCHVDQETGQIVEGLSILFTCSPLFLTLIVLVFFLKADSDGDRLPVNAYNNLEGVTMRIYYHAYQGIVPCSSSLPPCRHKALVMLSMLSTTLPLVECSILAGGITVKRTSNLIII